jgi:hypothetical protein
MSPETRHAKSGEVNIAYQVVGDGSFDLVGDLVAGSGIEFEDRGEHELKGVGSWRLYSVVDA